MRVHFFLAAAFAFGCSSPESPAPFDRGNAASSSGGAKEGDTPAVVPTTDPTTGVTVRLPYPEGPFGAVERTTIEDFRFLGWSRPATTGYDVDNLEPLRLADFYDPTGEKSISYLVINSAAVWCTACRGEYKDMVTKVAAYQARGVAFVGALYQDNDGNPAKPSDLKLWASAYKVDFPFVLDPAFKLSAFFDLEATPMIMIIDAKTMRILHIQTGWAPSGPSSLWTQLDGLLAK